MPQTNTPKTYPVNSTSMTNASTAICAAKQRPPTSSETTTAAIPTSINSQKRLRKRDSAKKRWKAVQSKRSVTTARRVRYIVEPLKRSKTLASAKGQKPSAISEPAVARTIAGSDSSAGAGVQADLKTFSALGVYGINAVTSVVAEIPGKVSRIEPLRPEFVREQIEVLAKNFPIGAVKTGLLCTRKIVAAVAQAIVDLALGTPLVVDPVFLATTGEVLLDRAAIEVCEKELFPRATLLTPNLDEATRLLGQKIADRAAMEGAARKLAQKYGTSVLLKGGHLTGEHAVDLLVIDEEMIEFSAPFVRGVTTHGTGCTY